MKNPILKYPNIPNSPWYEIPKCTFYKLMKPCLRLSPSEPPTPDPSWSSSWCSSYSKAFRPAACSKPGSCHATGTSVGSVCAVQPGCFSKFASGFAIAVQFVFRRWSSLVGFPDLIIDYLGVYMEFNQIFNIAIYLKYRVFLSKINYQ